jgi:hypothetical protein
MQRAEAIPGARDGGLTAPQDGTAAVRTLRDKIPREQHTEWKDGKGGDNPARVQQESDGGRLFSLGEIPQEPLKTAAIEDLIPTQVTVGMREVDFKRRQWREKGGHQAAFYLTRHIVPVILGSGQRYYIIDRHHLTRALHDEGVRHVPILVVADMSALDYDDFWAALESRNWAHPFNDEGQRCSYIEIPSTVNGLIDDPFRSLAGAVKRAGGYVKDRTPFSEFRWADFLRCRIARETVECDFEHAVAVAMNLARSHEAAALPGWQGDLA